METSVDRPAASAQPNHQGAFRPICKFYVIDSNATSREHTATLLSSYGCESEQFESGRSFLSALSRLDQGVVLLDLKESEVAELSTLEALVPHVLRFVTIVTSDSTDVSSAVAAMRLGAADFLQRPLQYELLLSALFEAQSLLMKKLSAFVKQAAAKERLAGLSRTEMKVLRYMISGMTVGEAAQYFRVSKRTLEMHRSAIYAKLGTKQLAEIVQLALDARIPKLMDAISNASALRSAELISNDIT